jgi:HPt (histidine-containing phosphotransfer) domain-containing protein
VSKPIQPEVLFTVLAGHVCCDEQNASGSGSEALATWTAEPICRQNVVEDDLPLIDFEKLASLEAVLPASSVRDLVRLYLVDADQQIALIRDCRTTDGLEGIAQGAHVITSTAGNVGAARVSSLARQLNDACRTKDAVAVARLIEDLVVADAATSEAIRVWLSRSAVGQDRQTLYPKVAQLG